MTPAEIAALRALADAATPGPWTKAGPGSGWGDHVAVLSPDDDGPSVVLAWGSREWKRDAAFIAAARTSVPALLDEVERLRGALRGMLARHGEPGPTNPFRCVCFDCETARRVLGEAGKEGG